MDSYKEPLKALARPYRKAVLKALLVLTMLGGALFAMLNLLTGSYPLAIVELAMGAYAILVYRAVRNTQHLERWIIAYAIPFFTAMMFAMTIPRASATVHAWVLLIPIVSHLLMGRRLGLAISVFYMSIAGIIFLLRYHDEPAMMQALPIANIAVISLCILVFSHVYEVTREQSQRQLLKIAQTDTLTGLANRARLSDIFKREQQRTRRYNTPMTLLALDLDHFKAFNDQWGHQAGDACLRAVAEVLRHAASRHGGLAARFGGEEFIFLLRADDAGRAQAIAEELRVAIERIEIEDHGATSTATCTSSIGIALHQGPEAPNLARMLSAADAALYRAKADGRNRTMVET